MTSEARDVLRLDETRQEAPLPAPATPMEMLSRAVASGADIEVIREMKQLYEWWDTNTARRAFDRAIAAAKAEIPAIGKNREVDFTSSKGRTHYRHEDLAEITRTVAPILGRHGLSYRFRTTNLPNEPVSVTCIVSHRDGHFEENTLSAGKDESGNKNGIQAIGSTITYLQRYTLKAALGLAASNDDDGQKAGAGDPITEDQIAELRTMLDATNSDIAAFCRFAKIEALPELPAAKFPAAMARLREKAAKMEAT